MDRISIFFRDTIVAVIVIGIVLAVRNFIWGKKIPPKIENARWLIAVLVGIFLFALSFLLSNFEQSGYATTVIAFTIYIIGSWALKNDDLSKEGGIQEEESKTEKETEIHTEKPLQNNEGLDKENHKDILHKNLHPAVFIIICFLIMVAVIYFGTIRPNIQKSNKPVVDQQIVLEEENKTSVPVEKPLVEKSWEEFVSTDYNFKILFPSKPKEYDGLRLYDNIINSKAYQVTVGGTLYQIGVLEYSGDTDMSHPDFESAMEEKLALGDAELVSSKKTNKTIDFLGKNFTMPTGKSYVRAKLTFAGRIEYTLSVFYKNESEKLNSEKFINSFQLLK